MDSEGRRAKEMIKGLPFKERVKHFWYYYQKHVYVIVVAVVIVAWGTAQCINKPKYDLNIAYYTSRGADQGVVDEFADSLGELVKDIDGNESTDVFVSMYMANITGKVLDQQAQALLTKIPLELSADDFPLYILDKAFMEYFERVYPESIANKILLSDIPEGVDALKIYEGEEVYLVTIAESNRVKDDEKKMAERENAMIVQEYFAQKAEEAENAKVEAEAATEEENTEK